MKQVVVKLSVCKPRRYAILSINTGQRNRFSRGGPPHVQDVQPASGQLDFPSIDVGRRGWIGQGCESS